MKDDSGIHSWTPITRQPLSDASDLTLSIVIVTFNCRDLTTGCLDSLVPEIARIASEEVEVIVVDNGSTDGTVAAVEAHPLAPIVIASGGNVGFAAANNVAIDRSRGRFILLLNPDTVVRPGTLVGALEALRRHTASGMLGVKLVLPDGSLDHACKRGFPTPAGALGYFLRLDRLMPASRLATYRAGASSAESEEDVDAISGAFMLVRREAVVDVGLMDEEYWMYSEDLDWCARFQRAGWRVTYWPGGEVLHLKGGSGGHRSLRTNMAFHRGMIRFHRLHGGDSRAVHALVAGGVWLRLGLSIGVGYVRRTVLRRQP